MNLCLKFGKKSVETCRESSQEGPTISEIPANPSLPNPQDEFVVMKFSLRCLDLEEKLIETCRESSQDRATTNEIPANPSLPNPTKNDLIVDFIFKIRS